MEWLELQLADSAFPSGGFVHSQGVEAALQLGVVPSVEMLFAQLLWQVGFGSLPFVRAGAIAEVPLFVVCREADAFLTNAVQNRASRTQGRGLLRVAREAFGERTEVASLLETAESTNMHYAPIFGALVRSLKMTPRDGARIFLHGAARNFLSAAVRLGMVGPLEAQRILASGGGQMTHVLTTCADLRIDDAVQTAPVLDLAAALHDRLYTRLFQS